MGLCPPVVTLDGGSVYAASQFQLWLWERWEEFCNVWVPHVTKGEPWDLVVNGDALDGVHHGATTQISHNLNDQALIALEVLKPLVARAESYYHIRGTEAHVGKSGAEEERLARELGSIPDSDGRHARWEYMHEMMGEDGKPRNVHFAHHINNAMFTATTLSRHLNQMYTRAGKWEGKIADVIVRGHQHRYSQVQLAGKRGLAIGAISPGWQGTTPFGYRIAAEPPEFGGMVVRVGDEGLYTRAKVWSL
jgi:hypothetical protein